MNAKEILDQLEALGTEQTKKTHRRHGAPEPLFGVKVGDLKTIQKKVKKNHELSLELYSTGNSDAMYLAGLIADEKRITRADLQRWADEAPWYMISEYTVPWIAAESAHGWELALEWIDSTKPHVAAAGWSCLASLVAIKADSDLDLKALEKLLTRVKKEIHAAPNRVRYAMNCYVISLGAYVAVLTEKAISAAEAIGDVIVDMEGTACKVPSAADYIRKIEKMGRIGKKKKMARC